MISILYTVVFAEMALILILLFRSPLRAMVIVGMDRLKQGKGPLVAKTVAITLLVILSSILYNVKVIQKRFQESGAVNPTDEVLMAERLLEASLMGFSLFLAMMADRLHYHIKELNKARKEMEGLTRSMQDDYGGKRRLGMEGNDKANVRNQETVSRRKTNDAQAQA